MRIEQLEQAVEVFSSGSINKAAQKNYISQSSLSASINRLECELGYKIYYRKQNGIELTEYGELFIEKTKALLELYHEIQNIAEFALKTKKRRFCISVYYLNFAIREFIQFYNQNRNDETEFVCCECSRGQVIENVSNGDAEIGILVMPDLLKSQWLEYIVAKGLEYHTISNEKIKILVGDTNPLAKNKKDEYITFDELKPFDMVWYPEQYDLFKAINQEIRSRYQIKHVVDINGRGSLEDMLKFTNGYLIGVFNENAYRQNPYPSGIRVFTLTGSNIHKNEIGYVKRSSEVLSEYGDMYLNSLIHMLQEA